MRKQQHSLRPRTRLEITRGLMLRSRIRFGSPFKEASIVKTGRKIYTTIFNLVRTFFDSLRRDILMINQPSKLLSASFTKSLISALRRSGRIHTSARQILHIALAAFMVLPALVLPTVGQGAEEVSFRQEITTPSGTALGGTVDLTLRSDGTYKAHFHMHDSGAVDYKFVVRAVFAASNGTAFALQHSGQVEGTESIGLTSSPRRDSDKDLTGANQLIKENWRAVQTGHMSVSKDYSKAGVIGFIEDLSKVVLDVTKGAARGAVGAVIGLGDEMVQAFDSLEFAGAIGLVAGVAVVASGGSLVLAVTTGVQAGLVTAALIKQRPLEQYELDFAEVVFQKTLPPRQNIILTNLESFGGRAFTMPGGGNKIYINIGGAAFDNPSTHVEKSYPMPGQLFIHEMTHVWQILHKTFVPGWVCSGLLNQVGNYFDNVYAYTNEGALPWSDFNIEQQASIVDDWFGGTRIQGQAGQDPSDPYFPYIRDNLRGTRPSVRNDFNNDSMADILWYNASTGETLIWYMAGWSRIGRATVTAGGRPAPIGPPWRIVGSSNFDRDGGTDILWYNSATGETQIWNMNGAERKSTATVLDESGRPIFIGPPWSIVGTGTNVRPQIVWHNSSTGETQLWRMDNNRMTGRATVLGENGKPTLVGPPWRIVASGDFNGDSEADILWHNSSSNETQIWLLNDRNVIGRRTVLGEDGKPQFVGLPWSIVGADDYNRDGAGDILWHNRDSGETQMWLMKAHLVVRRATVVADRDGGGAAVGLPWSIVPNTPPPSGSATTTEAPPPTPPFISAGQPIIPPYMPYGIVPLWWDGGPDHPNVEVWLSMDNGAEIPAFSMDLPPQADVWKQPKISIAPQLQRYHYYKFVLKAAGKTLSTAAFVVP
jgi:hypothetical protein